jgi:iron-only hydrogenase group A
MSNNQKVSLIIDGNKIETSASSTIMEAADELGIHIPRLCYHPELSALGACRICVVEIEGEDGVDASCCRPVEDGMKVKTSSPQLRRIRRDIVELILDNHPKDCQTCTRDGNCELQDIAYQTGVRERLYEGERKEYDRDTTSPAIERDPEKCILCGRCIRVCDEVQGVSNLWQQYRGFQNVAAPAYNQPIEDSVCIRCGQCANVCPTAAIVEKNMTDEVFEALEDPEKHVVVQTAPSIRAALGEGFGYEPGTPVTGKMVTALRLMGFDTIFDTDLGADLTIVEEANEFLSRFRKNENLPLITSCSPGWISFLETFYPELIPHASTCKSPMSMLSTLIKTYYAEQENIDPENIYSVAMMPCTAKKYEADRKEHQQENGIPYTDAVLTTRELIWMCKCMGIDFRNLPDSQFDRPLGNSSGGGDIFGTTGGVTETSLRTAYEKFTGKECTDLDFMQVRGTSGIKEASIELDGETINIGIANGLNNAKKLFDLVKNGEKEFHLIEIMACPGGCVGGGGQPYPPKDTHALDPQLVKRRAKALYSIDSHKKLRKSHENPAILKLYKDFLDEPNSKKAHQLLHTTYKASERRGIK